MKGLILAAGLGTRLRPLTLHIPKPLCLFMGRPIMDLAYKQMRKAGLDQIAVNTHHLAPTISNHIAKQASLYDRAVHISFEPEILGTGGCINPLRPWIGQDSLMLFNGDIIADMDLNSLVESFKSSQALATMVVLPHKPGTTPLYVAEDRVLSIGTEPKSDKFDKKSFAGIHVLSPEFMARIPSEGFQHVIDTYQEFLKEGRRIQALPFDGFWADLGNPGDYVAAHQTYLKMGLSNRQLIDAEEFFWDERGQTLYTFQPKHIYENCTRSFVFGPIRLTADQAIDRCIIYEGSKLIDKTLITQSILTPFVDCAY